MSACKDKEDKNITVRTEEGKQIIPQSDLHRHALDNKHFQLANILENSSNKLEELKCKSDGLSVLQAACKVTSLNVIDQISRLLEHEGDFINCIKQLSDDGDSTLHIVVKENNAVVLQKLLSNIGDHSVRTKVMETENRSGQTVQQLVDSSDRELIKQLVTNHHLVSTGSLQRFFVSFDGSLFAIKLEKYRVHALHDKVVKENFGSDDLDSLRRLNMGAAICLLHKDLERAKDFVDKALAQDKHDIHTLCNHGLLLMKQDSDMSLVQAVALAMLDSMYGQEELGGQDSKNRRAKSKIDYAYWMTKSDESQPSREESCKIFQKCLEEQPLTECLREYCSYYYLRVLIKHIRYDIKFEKIPQRTRTLLHNAIDLLINLSRSTNDKYLGDMWLWLSELQSKAVSKDYWSELSKKFHRETEMKEEISSETCVNKAIEIAERASDKRFTARIAKNCLQCGYQGNETSTMIHWFNKALEMSRSWIQENGESFMCVSTCAEALRQLWVMKFYADNRELVHHRYQCYYTERDIDRDSEVRIRHYVADTFYSKDITHEVHTVKYLVQAKKYLATIIEYLNAWESLGIKYVRIKCLLDDPEDEVKEAFRRVIFASERGVLKAKAYQHFGYYFGMMGKPEQAKILFTEAIYECRMFSKSSYEPEMALRGIKMIDRGENFG